MTETARFETTTTMPGSAMEALPWAPLEEEHSSAGFGGKYLTEFFFGSTEVGGAGADSADAANVDDISALLDSFAGEAAGEPVAEPVIEAVLEALSANADVYSNSDVASYHRDTSNDADADADTSSASVDVASIDPELPHPAAPRPPAAPPPPPLPFMLLAPLPPQLPFTLVVPTVPTSTRPSPKPYTKAQFQTLDPRLLSTVSCLFGDAPAHAYGLGAYSLGVHGPYGGAYGSGHVGGHGGVSGGGAAGGGGQGAKTKGKKKSKKRETSATTCAGRAVIAAKRTRVNGRFVKEESGRLSSFA